MKTRNKLIIAAAVAAGIAGTSGAALAASAPQAASHAMGIAAQRANGRPNITSQTTPPITGVKWGNASFREPGWEWVTVRAYKCITDVRAWAYSAAPNVRPVSSAVNTHRGTVFTLRVIFPRGAKTGTWFLTSVDATACGTRSVQYNTEWNGFRTFTVLPPK